ncbi:MAG: hypothetical protein AMXMBFR33_27320 [Candidatus Xenobia bacterium]
MPDQRTHRGPHPEDGRWFNEDTLPRLQLATAELSWLLERGYSGKASLTLVGDRHALSERQRMAVYRSSCAPSVAAARRSRMVEDLPGQSLAIDGFNLLITVEAALSGGVLLRGCDGCVRDLASMHGSYRRVAETERAVELCRQALRPCQGVQWLLDQPVSNSGRLAARLRQAGFTVELVANPDRLLAESPAVVVSTDRFVLDRCERWHNLAASMVEELGAPVWELGAATKSE